MKKVLIRYKFALAILAANLALIAVSPAAGKASVVLTKNNFVEMLTIVIPIFILLGLLDVWVGRETMMKYMGDGAGPKGALIAFVMGSAAAGPLYAAFPVAGVLLKKGVSLTNVFIFIGAWSTTKIPMLLFEAGNLGTRFMLLRFGCNLIGIFAIAAILTRTASPEERAALYETAKEL
ncbi:MAG TPA: permease [Candidatus Acidoferrum sp.]|nr:permease [Candidatus Acidoferrum sp.]